MLNEINAFRVNIFCGTSLFLIWNNFYHYHPYCLKYWKHKSRLYAPRILCLWKIPKACIDIVEYITVFQLLAWKVIFAKLPHYGRSSKIKFYFLTYAVNVRQLWLLLQWRSSGYHKYKKNKITIYSLKFYQRKIYTI